MNMTIKISIAVIVVALIAFGAYVYMTREEPVTTIIPKDITIVAFGDSLVRGYGATAGKNFVSLLSVNTKQQIINVGKDGDTTAKGLDRVQLALVHKPDIVILLLGGNDFLRSVPQAETFANLGKIIETIQASGAQVLLLGIRGGLLTDIYSSKFEDLADKYSVEYVPNVLNGLLGNENYMYDAIHPNDAGYEIIAKKIEPVLLRMIQKAK